MHGSFQDLITVALTPFIKRILVVFVKKLCQSIDGYSRTFEIVNNRISEELQFFEALPQCLLRSLALGRILNGEKNLMGLVGPLGYPSGIQMHYSSPDSLEFVFYLEIVEGCASGQYLFQKFSQLGNVPLSIP